MRPFSIFDKIYKNPTLSQKARAIQTSPNNNQLQLKQKKQRTQIQITYTRKGKTI